MVLKGVQVVGLKLKLRNYSERKYQNCKELSIEFFCVILIQEFVLLSNSKNLSS